MIFNRLYRGGKSACRYCIMALRYLYFTKLRGMDIARSSRISVGSCLDSVNPCGIHIGDESYIASGAIIFTHDYCRGIHQDTFIGRKCFIGANAIIMCGVRVGDEVVVGSGAIVTKDVPNNCVVAGNPAKIIRYGIHTIKYGKMCE